MPISELEEFAKILVQKVRDAAIRSADMQLRSDVTSPRAKRWQTSARDGSPETFAKMIIPDIVDLTIAKLLDAIDQELLRLSFNSSNEKPIDLTRIAKESGELTGWYHGQAGWCGKYSTERFNDDFGDLKNSSDEEDI